LKRAPLVPNLIVRVCDPQWWLSGKRGRQRAGDSPQGGPILSMTIGNMRQLGVRSRLSMAL